MSTEEDDDFKERVSGWTAHHFSITDKENNVPHLLRRVADSLERLGDIQVHDMTFCVQSEGPALECQITVYLEFNAG
jgi:hypothetical protein